ncbi:putative reverse transcriptase zinc-binding domain-containing protein [Helianthus anomalus]
MIFFSLELSAFLTSRIAVPKVNLFVWRAVNERIPTAVALAERGVHLEDTRCGACGVADETASHLLASCVFARAVWWQVFVWCKIPIPASFDTLSQILSHCCSLDVDKKKKQILYAICLMTVWCIWMHRNNKLFNGKNNSVSMVVEEIKTGTFWWMNRRRKRTDISLEDWNSFSGFNFT